MLSIPFRRTLDIGLCESPQLLQNGKFHQLGPFIALASQSDPKLKDRESTISLAESQRVQPRSISPARFGGLGHSPYSQRELTPSVFFGLPKRGQKAAAGQFECAPRQLTHVWMIELLSLDRAVRNYQVGRLGVSLQAHLPQERRFWATHPKAFRSALPFGEVRPA
jgi:hypothetical protein